jgi:predicted RNA-binding protein with PIN domain
MPLIVDTFNVLHQTGVLPPDLAGVDVAGLIDLISRSRFRRSRVRLVCDSVSRLPDEVSEVGIIAIEFSGRGRTADDVIADRINRSTAPKRLTIVSSDREVQKAARRRRCIVLSSPEFLRQLAADVERGERDAGKNQPQRPKQFTRPLSQRDTAKWMREFGVDESDPPLTNKQMEELDEAVDAMLGHHDDETGDTQHEDKDPTVKRSQARMERARAREHAELEATHQEDALPLPEDLLAEAERLWKHERKSPSRRDT